MPNTSNPLKIAEVRQLVKGHKREHLEHIVDELYKMLSKTQKLDNDVANLLRNPGTPATSGTGKQKQSVRSFDEVKKETEFFITNAYEQNYLAPNRSVSKKDRPKWRFLVKKVFQELKSYLKQPEYQGDVAVLLEKLYEVLCYSCAYQLFTAYDTFESTGIPQSEFFDTLLTSIEQVNEKPVFIEKGIDLILNNELNRYTLHSELMNTFLHYLVTTDLKYMLIEKCRNKREALIKDGPDKTNWSGDYNFKGKLNNLTELVFRSYMRLYETKNAVGHYKEFYTEKSPEVKLYILISLLMEFKEKDTILYELQEAEKQKIKLRPSLVSLKNYLIEKDSLPEYI